MRPRRIIILTAVGAAVAMTFCVGSPLYYFRKTRGVPADRLRTPVVAPYPVAVVPDQQTEPHTCGYHSIRAVYTAYGLDPDERRLRFRLGVDKPLNNLLPDSRGTIHPDMIRVLEQDGFACRVLLPWQDGAAPLLAGHLRAGHLAIALTRANDLHWVVLSRSTDEVVLVADSLVEEPYAEPLDSYLDERVYSLLLVEPR